MNESHTYPSVTKKNIKFKNHEYSFDFNEDDIVLFVGDFRVIRYCSIPQAFMREHMVI